MPDFSISANHLPGAAPDGVPMPQRMWAIEGCQGIGRHIARRLLADGERVVDVPPKLSARTRVFTAGQGRKTDATDARTRSRWPALA